MDEAETIADDAPWKQRYRAEQIFWAQLAETNPAHGLVATDDANGVIQLHAWETATGSVRTLTHDPHGVAEGMLSPDGRHIYLLDDSDGDEIGHLVRIPFMGGAPQDLTPDLPPYSLAPPFGAVSRDGGRLAFTVANGEGFALLTVDLLDNDASAPPRSIFKTEALISHPILSEDGALAVVASTEQTGDQHYSLIVFDTLTGERVAELWDGPDSSVSPAAFSPLPNDVWLLATTTRSGFTRPLLWHPRTGARQDLALPGLEGDVLPYDWSPDGTRLLLCQVHRATQRLVVYDRETGRVTGLQHPSGSIGAWSERGAFFAPHGEIWAEWQDATHPAQLIALESATGTQVRTVLAAGPVPSSQPWRSITFLSSDGQEIQGWLARPPGSGPFPTILDTHGGPEDVQTQVFSPAAQSWLDHGFAFLSINYRGSTTFGRTFQEQIWGNLGYWEVEDIVAARDWLIAQRISRPDRIILSGWSYGGYLTLLALGRRPELWAGGIAGAAIADWTMLYEDAADFIRGYLVAMFGGTPEEKSEAYALASPLTYAEKVDSPLLIIQGRNDGRTPARPVEIYVEQLIAQGKQVEIEWYDRGHLGGSTQTAQAIAHQERSLLFARRCVAHHR